MTATNDWKRVLLLLSPLTYRAGAFLGAAERLDLEAVKGVDMPKSLAEYWNQPFGLDFSRPDEATAHDRRRSRRDAVRRDHLGGRQRQPARRHGLRRARPAAQLARRRARRARQARHARSTARGRRAGAGLPALPAQRRPAGDRRAGRVSRASSSRSSSPAAVASSAPTTPPSSSPPSRAPHACSRDRGRRPGADRRSWSRSSSPASRSRWKGC